MKSNNLVQQFCNTQGRSLLLILLCSAFLLAACGNSDSGQQTEANSATTTATVSNTLDACTLLSKTDVEAALGEPVKEPTNSITVEESANGTVALSICSFSATGDYRKSLTLMVRRAQTDESGAAIAFLQHTYSDTQTISGLGDNAIWADHQLNVFKGGTLYLSVRVWDLADDTNALTQAKALAQKVLAQL